MFTVGYGLYYNANKCVAILTNVCKPMKLIVFLRQLPASLFMG
jgi:hypothetical protein